MVAACAFCRRFDEIRVLNQMMFHVVLYYEPYKVYRKLRFDAMKNFFQQLPNHWEIECYLFPFHIQQSENWPQHSSRLFIGAKKKCYQRAKKNAKGNVWKERKKRNEAANGNLKTVQKLRKEKKNIRSKVALYNFLVQLWFSLFFFCFFLI